MDLNSSGSGGDIQGAGSSSDSPTSTPRKGRGRKGRGRGRQRSTSPLTPPKDPQVGDMVWAKVKNHRWWPAVLVNTEDCGQLATRGGRRTTYFVYWYGDGRVSPIAMANLVDFRRGYQRFITPPGSITFTSGVYLAIKDLSKFLMLDSDDWDTPKMLAWADDGFPLPEECEAVRTHGTVSQHVRQKLRKLRVKYEENEEGREHDAADSSLYLEYASEKVDLIHSVRDGTVSLDDICLACVTKSNALQEHPLFYGSICGPCKEKFLQLSFSVGLDLVAFHCSICMDLGDLMVCSQPHCFRAYCCKCIVMKATVGVIDIIREADPWACFLCEPYTVEMHGLLKPRSAQWKRNMWQAFHSEIPDFKMLKSTPLRILCFDGSCDTVLAVLSIIVPLGINIEALFLCNYSETEMKKLPPNILEQTSCIDSCREYEDYEALSELSPIHIVMASPEDKEKEMFGRKFFSFFNIVSMLKIVNRTCENPPFPPIPLMWVLEVAPPHWHDYNIVISRYLEFEPAIWSKHLSRRKSSNLMWTNIPSLWHYLDHCNISQSKMNKQENDQQTRECKSRRGKL